MAQGNVGTVRITALWGKIEPSPGQFDFSYLDFAIGQAAAHGIRVLPVMYGSPGWIDKDCTGLTASQCERVPPLATQAARDAWKRFLVTVVGRYGPGGVFWQQNPGIPTSPTREWQIWNEPSSSLYWQREPSSSAYALLVKLSHQAITEVDPKAKIVLGGLFGTPQGDLSSKDVMWRFLGRLYGVPGIEKAFDSIALHPYSPNLEGVRFQLEKAVTKLRQKHDAKTEIIITEIGWGSDPPTPASALLEGLDGQRTMLEKSFRLLRRERRDWNIGGVIWYAWQDPGVAIEGCSFCESVGLFEEDGTPKPAWNSFTTFTAGTP